MEEQWNRNPVSCAEPVLYCSCADHGRLRGTRGISAPVCSCVRDRVAEFRVCVAAWLRGRLVPLQGYQVRSGEIQRSSAEPGLSGTIRGLQVLPGSGGSCRPLPRSSAQLRCCAAALGVPRCIGFYLRKRSCRHTAAYGSLSLSVCVATLLHSGSTQRHSQGLQCFLSRSPVLSSSFQRNPKLS